MLPPIELKKRDTPSIIFLAWLAIIKIAIGCIRPAGHIPSACCPARQSDCCGTVAVELLIRTQCPSGQRVQTIQLGAVGVVEPPVFAGQIKTALAWLDTTWIVIFIDPLPPSSTSIVKVFT